MFDIFTKVFIIFLMIAIGFVANRKGALPIEASPHIVSLLLTVTTPCMIFESMATAKLNDAIFRSTIEVLVGSVVYFILIVPLSLFLVKTLRYPHKKDYGVLMCVIASVSNGFMGFPLTKSIFGDTYLLLMVIANVILTIYMYSAMLLQLHYGDKRQASLTENLKPVINMCTGATVVGFIIFFTQWRVPALILEPAGMIGDATVPLSMILAGIQLGNSNLRTTLKNKGLIIASLYKMILIPVLTFCAVNWLPLTPETKLVLVFSSTLPSAVVAVALAAREGKNAALMAEGVAFTTLLSMVTLPIAAILLMWVYI